MSAHGDNQVPTESFDLAAGRVNGSVPSFERRNHRRRFLQFTWANRSARESARTYFTVNSAGLLIATAAATYKFVQLVMMGMITRFLKLAGSRNRQWRWLEDRASPRERTWARAVKRGYGGDVSGPLGSRPPCQRDRPGLAY